MQERSAELTADVAKAEEFFFGGPVNRGANSPKPQEWPMLSPPVWYNPDTPAGSGEDVLSAGQVA